MEAVVALVVEKALSPWGRRGHVQNDLWWNALLLLCQPGMISLLLHDRVVKTLLHSFYAYVLLLHDLP